ncbi:nuclear transport factor 2 family protein [Halorarius halobius]|uniref:nuclear transport factor 2 family protein n=1 Tax=Halorarius halobius TaxID=2962671 RepID=UPI0020CF4C12|nr:nuclear transport factor 2 family protein [Halorarius halobius]
MDPAAAARDYYDAIDSGEYDRLRGLLADEFVHDRPDRVIDGADAFVAFMREDRPRTDTDHVLEELYVAAERVAVEGRLVAADGDPMFGFVDTFEFDGDRIRRIRTYTD